MVPIFVRFEASASGADIAKAIHAAGGREVRDLKQLHIHVINVPRARKDQILAAYAHHRGVARAAVAVKLTTAGIPTASTPTSPPALLFTMA